MDKLQKAINKLHQIKELSYSIIDYLLEYDKDDIFYSYNEGWADINFLFEKNNYAEVRKEIEEAFDKKAIEAWEYEDWDYEEQFIIRDCVENCAIPELQNALRYGFAVEEEYLKNIVTYYNNSKNIEEACQSAYYYKYIIDLKPDLYSPAETAELIDNKIEDAISYINDGGDADQELRVLRTIFSDLPNNTNLDDNLEEKCTEITNIIDELEEDLKPY